jgi:N-acetylneuraminic acid mutarotase
MRTRTLLFLLLALLSSSLPAFAQTEPAAAAAVVTKTVHDNLPEKALFNAVVVHGKIYAFKATEDGMAGGEVAGGRVYVFDPRSRRWAARAPMPLHRTGYGLATLHDRVFMIGGFSRPNTPEGTVQEYDPATDQWTTRKEMPTARGNMGVVVLAGKIYVLGGRTKEGGHTDAVEAYDPTTGTWATRQRLSQPLMGIEAVAVDGKILKLRGTSVRNGRWQYVMGLEEYDPGKDAWSKRAEWTFDPEPVDMALVDGRLFVFGGGAFSAPGTHSLWEYDFAADRWLVRADMPAANAHTIHPAWAVAGGRIYTFGGGIRASGGWRWSDRVQRYDPGTDRWEELAPLSEARLYMDAVVVGDEIFVIGGETTDESSGERGTTTYSSNVDVYRVGDRKRGR